MAKQDKSQSLKQKGWVTVDDLFKSIESLEKEAETDKKSKEVVESAERAWESGDMGYVQ